MRRVIGMSAASAALIVACGHAALAQSLSSVPDNAIVFAKVNRIDQTNKKLSALLKQWGVAAMDPQFADPLATLQSKLKVDKGLKTDGDLAVIVFNTQAIPGPHEGPPVVVMLPITDYAVFSSNFVDATVEGDITDITLPETQEPAYMAQWGNYAAISTDRKLVSQKPKASKAGGLAGKELTDKDIVVYVNFASFRQQANAFMGMGQMMMAGQMEQAAQAKPATAKYAGLAKIFVQQLFTGLTHVVNETQAVTYGVSLSDQGVQVTYLAEFAPKSYLAGLVQSWKPQGATAIAGLPAGKYAAVAAWNIDGATANTLINDALGPIVTEAQTMGEDGKPIVDYIQATTQIFASTRSQTFGMTVGQGEAGKSPLFNMVSVLQGEAAKIAQGELLMISSQEEFQNALMPAGAGSKTALVKGAKTVDGVKFDQATVTADTTSGSPAQQKMVEAMYGPGGIQMSWGAVNPQTLLLTTHKDDAAISSAIVAAKAMKPMLIDAPTKASLSALPSKGFMQAFIYGDQIMEMVSKGSQTMMGMPIEFKIPADTPPVALGMSTEGTAVRMDLYVPSPLIEAIAKAAMQEAVKGQQVKQKAGGL